MLLAVACSSTETEPESTAGQGDEASSAAVAERPERYALQQTFDNSITVTSTSIGGSFGWLDKEHTCESADSSPQIQWEGVPGSAASLALLIEDPASDAVGIEVDVLWAHWVLYSIPADVAELAVGQSPGDTLDNGATQGMNDYEKVQYNGPCPIPNLIFPTRQSTVESGRIPVRDPELAEERPYFIRLYALDQDVDLSPGANRDTLLKAIDGHILAGGEETVVFKSRLRRTCTTPSILQCLVAIGR